MLIGQPNQRNVLAIISIRTQPISCHRLSLITLGLAGHLGLADWRPSTLCPITVGTRLVVGAALAEGTKIGRPVVPGRVVVVAGAALAEGTKMGRLVCCSRSSCCRCSEVVHPTPRCLRSNILHFDLSKLFHPTDRRARIRRLSTHRPKVFEVE